MSGVILRVHLSADYYYFLDRILLQNRKKRKAKISDHSDAGASPQKASTIRNIDARPCEVPHVNFSDYQLIAISEDGFVTLSTENGNTKNDVRLPTDDALLTQLKDEFAEGKDLVVVTVMSAMGEEQISGIHIAKDSVLMSKSVFKKACDAISKSLWGQEDIDFEISMEEAKKLKRMGNRLFRQGRPELASEHFHEALHQLEQINGNTDAEKEALLDLKNAINVNLGACYLKLGGFKGSLGSATDEKSADEESLGAYILPFGGFTDLLIVILVVFVFGYLLQHFN